MDSRNRQPRLGNILIVVVVICILSVAGLVGARKIIAPSFTAANGDYRYQWHRVDNEQEWKEFKIKYQGSNYCSGCHPDQFGKITASMHARVQCENCHGPAIDHPDKPGKLAIDRSRGLCLRCHASLPYRPVVYSALPKTVQLKMQDPDKHNPGMECVNCHDPHKAELKQS